MKGIIQIYILARDRPKYLKEAIESVLNQKTKEKIEIIVSDNSENNTVGQIVSQYFSNKKLKYIKRSPPLSAIKHFQLVISEASKKYVVLFHDDDILHHNYIETMLPFIQKKGVAAVGCNEYIFKNDFTKSLRAKPHNFNKPQVFINEKEFLEQYIPSNSGVSVFPGYMYNTELLKKIKLNNVRRSNGVSDVLMLNSLLKYGSIIWIPYYLVYYRLHDSNDGNSLYTADHITLLNRMSYNGLDKDHIAATMRFNYLLQWFLSQDIKSIFLWRNRIVLKYLFFKSFYLMRKWHLWKSLLNNRYVKNKFLR